MRQEKMRTIIAPVLLLICLMFTVAMADENTEGLSSLTKSNLPSILASSNVQQEKMKENQALAIPVIECVECPPGSTPEDEPECYDDYEDHTNGGCGSMPVVFGDVSCGQTICGTSGNFLYDGGQTKDTDWYNFYLTEGTEVTITAMAEFDMMVFILEMGPDNPCDGFQILYYEIAPICEEYSFMVNLPAGDYWIWVAPEAFEGVPCGSAYYFTVTCGGQNEIPTLTEWGMIILGLLLLAAGTMAVVRKRRLASAR